MSGLRLPEQQSFWAAMRRATVEREYCEWADPYLAKLRRPLGILISLAAASLLCGLFVAPQGFVMLAAISAVLLIGCLWPWIGIRGVSCQLRFNTARSEEGKPVDTELIVTNRWPWPVWGLAVEEGLGATAGESASPDVAIARIGGWSQGHFRWQFTPAVRGRYPVETPQLATEFPFGLWKAKKPVEVLSQLIVWPMRFPLPPLILPSGTQSWTGQSSECTAGNVGHRTSVREYRVGDSIRQIHWAKTALYDKLVSYEREGLAINEATISLDTHSALHRGTGPESSLEWTIRIAASVCEALIRQGVSVSIVTGSEAFTAVTSAQNPTLMLDWFALLNSRNCPPSNRIERKRRIPQRDSLTIHITTDQCRESGPDSIVIMTANDGASLAEHSAAKRCWIRLQQNSDIPAQIRRGWRSGPRKRSYAK